MKTEKAIGLKASVFAALALAFASFGDAFLYPFLPLNFQSVGLPVVWVGLILSINRFVRILSNAFMVRAFSRYGLRSIMVIAVILAITSTFGYGLAMGILSWVLLRIMWGLAFSAMRIGILGYALQHQRRGFSFGLSRSLQEAGPMLSLFVAPILITYLDSKPIFYFLSVLSLPALYFAWKLPVTDDKTKMVESRRLLNWPSTLNSITLVSAIVIDGIIVVVLGMLFLRYRDQIDLVTATALAASYLGYRRICLVALSTVGGVISDKVGMERMFNISLALVILGLLVIISGWIGTGAVIVFTFYSINSAITPGSALRSSHSLAAIAENATWRDIGAAIGTLLGGVLISSQYLSTVLTVAVLIMVSLLMAHLGARWKAFKLFYLWK
jgi:predicted MFS family arabinose efflux permease